MADSKRSPDSGESLFAVADIPTDMVYSLYSGIVMTKDEFWSNYHRWQKENGLTMVSLETDLAKMYL